MGLWKSPLGSKYTSLRNHMVGRIKQSQVSQDLLPPQGFGPDGQNPRRHSRGPPVLGRKLYYSRKNLDFSRTGLVKDCRIVSKGLPKLCCGSKKRSKESGRGVFATRFWSGKGRAVFTSKKNIYIYRCPSDLELKLWKLALLIDVFDRKMGSHLNLSYTIQT